MFASALASLGDVPPVAPQWALPRLVLGRAPGATKVKWTTPRLPLLGWRETGPQVHPLLPRHLSLLPVLYPRQKPLCEKTKMWGVSVLSYSGALIPQMDVPPFSFLVPSSVPPKRTCGSLHDQRLFGLDLGRGAHAYVLGVGFFLRPQRGVLRPFFAFVLARAAAVVAFLAAVRWRVKEENNGRSGQEFVSLQKG